MSEKESLVQDEKQEPVVESNEEKAPVDSIPYGRFKDIVNEKNDMKSELQQLKTTVLREAEERKLKEMEAKGEYESALEMVRSESAKKDSQIADMKTRLEEVDAIYDAEREELLTQLTDEDKAVYSGLNNTQLRSHLNKIKPNNVPSVGSDQPATTEGYKNLVDVARDYQKGNIDESVYNRIKNAFRTNQA